MEDNRCAECNESIPKTKKYCNLSCAGKGGRGRKFSNIIDAQCLNCSNSFTIRESELSKRKFCSKSCAASHTNSQSPNRPKRKEYSCKFCNKITLNANYCDLKCAALMRSRKALNKFLEGSSTVLLTSPTVYAYLLERQDGTCAVCDMPPVWNGKPLIFIHDHIDGNSENNDPANIRLVCSNCDSQLDTYKAKNKGSGRHYRRTRYAAGQSS